MHFSLTLLDNWSCFLRGCVGWGAFRKWDYFRWFLAGGKSASYRKLMLSVLEKYKLGV